MERIKAGDTVYVLRDIYRTENQGEPYARHGDRGVVEKTFKSGFIGRASTRPKWHAKVRTSSGKILTLRITSIRKVTNP